MTRLLAIACDLPLIVGERRSFSEIGNDGHPDTPLDRWAKGVTFWLLQIGQSIALRWRAS